MPYSGMEIKDGLLRNDPEIFRYLYRTYGGMISSYVYKNNGNEQDAVEMVQSVLLELWQSVKNNAYKEEGKIDRFIYTLTSNSWRDELRRRKVRKADALDPERIHIEDDSAQALTAAIIKDRRIDAIHHSLRRLDSPCDDIIRLYHLEEISLQDVAVKMNYEYNSLRKRIFDCRKKLKKLVEDYLSTQPY